MKKVIILRKMQVFRSMILQPEKENKHVHASAADLLHTILE